MYRIRKKRRIKTGLIMLAIVGAMILSVPVSDLFTPNVSAFLVSGLFNLSDKADAIRNPRTVPENVAVIRNIEYPSAFPDGTMDIYYPKSAAGRMPVVFWIHGGGWISGDKDGITYAPLLAEQGYVVACINYALAPAYKYPSAVIQANDALRYIVGHSSQYSMNVQKIFFAGDSAGAQIASQMASLITEVKAVGSLKLSPAIARKQVKGALLYCGLYDIHSAVSTGFPFIRTFLWSYTGTKNIQNKISDEMSTVNHITENYPPVFLTDGNADWFAPQAKELLKALQNRCVSVTALLFDGCHDKLGHEFQFDMKTSEARQVLYSTIAFLKQNSK